MNRLPWFIRWWPWVPTRWFVEQRREIDRLRSALHVIGTDCEYFTRAPWCPDRDSGRTRGARYSADAWCKGGVGREALR